MKWLSRNRITPKATSVIVAKRRLRIEPLENRRMFSASSPSSEVEVPSASVGVYVRGTAWTDNFLTNLGASGYGDRQLGYLLANSSEHIKPLPWANLDSITVQFDADVDFDSENTGMALIASEGPKSEFPVNLTTAEDQGGSASAKLADGDYVVVWLSYSNSSAELLGRLFHSDGSPSSSEFPVSDLNHTGGRTSVAATPNGGFVVAWDDDMSIVPNGSEAVFARRFDRFGSPLGSVIDVSPAADHYQIAPQVAVDSAGNFAVAWDGRGTHDVRLRRFNSDGSPRENLFVVAAGPGIFGSDLVSDDAGNLAMTWGADTVTGKAMFGQMFNSFREPVGSHFQINSSPLSQATAAQLAMGAGGNFVAAWSNNREGSLDVYARRFTANGQAASDEFRVNNQTDGEQDSPQVAMDANGNFVIAWNSLEESSETTVNVQIRRYSDSGLPQGNQVQVNSFAVGNQQINSLILDDTGYYFVTWQSDQQDGDGWGVFAERSSLLASATFTYDNAKHTASWSLPASLTAGMYAVIIPTADFLNTNAISQLGVDGPASSTPRLRGYSVVRFNVVPGDANQSGRVTGQDGTLIRTHLLQSTWSAEYSPFYDILGNGTITGRTGTTVRNRLLQSLPDRFGTSDAEIATRLKTSFGLTAAQTTPLLRSLEVAPIQIARALKSNFGCDSSVVADLLVQSGVVGSDVAESLVAVFDESDAKLIADLYSADVPAVDIAQALRTLSGREGWVAGDLMNAAGIPESEIVSAIVAIYGGTEEQGEWVEHVSDAQSVRTHFWLGDLGHYVERSHYLNDKKALYEFIDTERKLYVRQAIENDVATLSQSFTDGILTYEIVNDTSGASTITQWMANGTVIRDIHTDDLDLHQEIPADGTEGTTSRTTKENGVPILAETWSGNDVYTRSSMDSDGNGLSQTFKAGIRTQEEQWSNDGLRVTTSYNPDGTIDRWTSQDGHYVLVETWAQNYRYIRTAHNVTGDRRTQTFDNGIVTTEEIWTASGDYSVTSWDPDGTKVTDTTFASGTVLTQRWQTNGDYLTFVHSDNGAQQWQTFHNNILVYQEQHTPDGSVRIDQHNTDSNGIRTETISLNGITVTEKTWFFNDLYMQTDWDLAGKWVTNSYQHGIHLREQLYDNSHALNGGNIYRDTTWATYGPYKEVRWYMDGYLFRIEEVVLSGASELVVDRIDYPLPTYFTLLGGSVNTSPYSGIASTLHDTEQTVGQAFTGVTTAAGKALNTISDLDPIRQLSNLPVTVPAWFDGGLNFVTDAFTWDWSDFSVPELKDMADLSFADVSFPGVDTWIAAAGADNWNFVDYVNDRFEVLHSWATDNWIEFWNYGRSELAKLGDWFATWLNPVAAWGQSEAAHVEGFNWDRVVTANPFSYDSLDWVDIEPIQDGTYRFSIHINVATIEKRFGLEALLQRDGYTERHFSLRDGGIARTPDGYTFQDQLDPGVWRITVNVINDGSVRDSATGTFELPIRSLQTILGSRPDTTSAETPDPYGDLFRPAGDPILVNAIISNIEVKPDPNDTGAYLVVVSAPAYGDVPYNLSIRISNSDESLIETELRFAPRTITVDGTSDEFVFVIPMSGWYGSTDDVVISLAEATPGIGLRSEAQTKHVRVGQPPRDKGVKHQQIALAPRVVLTPRYNLTWDDFLAKTKPDTVPAGARAAVGVNVIAPAAIKIQRSVDGRSIVNVTPVAKLYRDKSWKRDLGDLNPDQIDRLLMHEQVHVDIAKLYGAALSNAFRGFKATGAASFDAEYTQLVNVVQDAFAKMEEFYDQSTDHGSGATVAQANAQAKWYVAIKKGLSDLAANRSSAPKITVEYLDTLFKNLGV